jgi:hypothetical protein
MRTENVTNKFWNIEIFFQKLTPEQELSSKGLLFAHGFSRIG